MNITEIIGMTAAVLSTGAFLPQALHVLRTRDTRAISLLMYTMALLGAALWAAYGFINMQMPIILANVVALVLIAAIFALKVRDVLKGRTAAKGHNA